MVKIIPPKCSKCGKRTNHSSGLCSFCRVGS